MADIVVGYDGSDFSRVALDKAIEVAGLLGDRVVVVFGFEVSRLGGEVQEYAKAVQERAQEVIAHATHHAEAKGVHVEARAVEEPPAMALADIAKQRDARMIIVGTRGESPAKGAILGSTAHRLLHLSEVPVLVVPD